MPKEHDEIKIEKVTNGYLITRSRWVEETCANREDKYIAINKTDVQNVLRDIFNENAVCLKPNGKCTFEDDDHDKHPKG